MYRLREATHADLPLIHRMQAIPIREKFLMTPLPSLEDYVANATAEMNAGNEHFYLLEEDSVPIGLVWICIPRETCEIWGKHLHSLFYACARTAFENLGMQRLIWWVRSKNRRMLSVCDRFQIRKTGSETRFTMAEKFEFLALDEIHYFEFKVSEYPERIPVMRKLSVQTGNFFPDSADTSNNQP